MRMLARWLTWGGAVAVALFVAGSGLTYTAAPLAVWPATAAVTQTAPVSPSPAAGTPALVATGTTIQTISQIAQCGTTMYAVGSFTEIGQNGVTYTRNNIFSFSAIAPYQMTSWTPDANGPVLTIALTSDCSHAYIGGQFTQVDGTPAGHIAYIRTYNNTMVQGFAHDANNAVHTILLAGTHLLVGGTFTKINGTATPYYVSLNPSTGAGDGYLNLNISGHYVYPKAAAIPTGVYNSQLSPASYGSYVLAEGVFTSVQGLARQQIFMMRLSSTHGNVTTWTSPGFNTHCTAKIPYYVQSAAWAPDGSAIYVGDTGLAPDGWNHTFPLTGLCDAVAAFPSSRVQVSPKWVNYTGCDSIYSVAADDSAVYAAGHPRWSSNANGCNDAGPGAVADRGLQGLSPASGATMVHADGTATYTMARANADDMLVTSAGLWIASTNRFGSDSCGGVGGHAGLCFLSYPS
jgi:hypothetical protein